MAEAFYPFVENGDMGSQSDDTLVVRHSARIAVFDDAAAAPRVVVIEPSDIRGYLEEITTTVTRLAQEQGGKIPFMVIREVVENLIHAYFIEPTVSILDGGNTIRFSDQGPGIQDKDRALEYGTTSATSEMKRYIRGVGSGLPYAQQWLEDKGGSLSIEDNIHSGTVVTVSLSQRETQSDLQKPSPGAYEPPQREQSATQPAWQPYQQPASYPQPQGTWFVPQAYQQPPLPQQAWVAAGQGYPSPQQGYAQPWAPGLAAGSPYAPQEATQQHAMQAAGIKVSERGMVALRYLMTHESVGPRDLNAIERCSESTWSRVLSQLETQGLVSKQGGQKRMLTQLGRQFLGITP